MVNKVILIGDDNAYMVKMYVDGMSIPEIHENTGIPLSTIRFRLLKSGVLRSRADGVRMSETRGRNPHSGNKKPRSDETKEKIRKIRLELGDANSIGVTHKKSGYVVFTRGPFKGRMVHDVIMEKHLKRKLENFEEVHHKDGIKSNNHIRNLQILTRSQHAALHAKQNNHKRTRNNKGQYA